MPRKEREHSETGIYHVMILGGANQRVPVISNYMPEKKRLCENLGTIYMYL